MVKEQKESKFLYIDADSYENSKRSEKELFKQFDALKNVAIDVLGSDYDIDFRDYVKDPKEYLIQKYFILSKRPDHLRKRAENILISDVGINLHTLQHTFKEFSRLYNSLAQLQPKITSKGLKSVLRENLFHKYLDPTKEKHYEAVKKFYDTAIALRDFGALGDIHLLRYSNSGLWLEHGKLTINYSVFAL